MITTKGALDHFSFDSSLYKTKTIHEDAMKAPHSKPLRQLAAEKARGNKPANPSQLGDPIDLKAETSDEPDPVESSYPGDNQGDNSGKKEDAKGDIVGLGSGAGAIGGVRKGAKL